MSLQLIQALKFPGMATGTFCQKSYDRATEQGSYLLALGFSTSRDTSLTLLDSTNVWEEIGHDKVSNGALALFHCRINRMGNNCLRLYSAVPSTLKLALAEFREIESVQVLHPLQETVRQLLVGWDSKEIEQAALLIIVKSEQGIPGLYRWSDILTSQVVN